MAEAFLLMPAGTDKRPRDPRKGVSSHFSEHSQRSCKSLHGMYMSPASNVIESSVTVALAVVAVEAPPLLSSSSSLCGEAWYAPESEAAASARCIKTIDHQIKVVNGEIGRIRVLVWSHHSCIRSWELYFESNVGIARGMALEGAKIISNLFTLHQFRRMETLRLSVSPPAATAQDGL